MERMIKVPWQILKRTHGNFSNKKKGVAEWVSQIKITRVLFKIKKAEIWPFMALYFGPTFLNP